MLITGLPPGGKAGDTLVKLSDADYNVGWRAAAPASGTVPTLTSIEPLAVGLSDPDLTVTVRGTGFVAASEILWNLLPIATTYISDTELTTLVQPSLETLPKQVGVSVRNAPGTNAALPMLEFRFISNPRITSLVPDMRQMTGSDFELIVQGSGFTNEATCPTTLLWDGAPIPTNPILWPTQFSANMVRPDVAGIHAVTVRNGTVTADTAPLDFEYLLPYRATALIPDNCPADGPDIPVTVQGYGFTAQTTVVWNGNPYTTTFVSDTELTILVEPSPPSTTHAVNVRNAAGIVSEWPSLGFTYS